MLLHATLITLASTLSSAPPLLAPPLLAEFAPQESVELQQERERRFAALLDNVRLEGFFTDASRTDGKLSKDSYTIDKVVPVGEGQWRFEAIVEFGERDVPMSITLPVEWAGDTPVITVTDKSFSLLGTYSARVLFHDGQYVGVWGGEGHSGQMFGMVVKRPKADDETQPEPEAEDKKQSKADLPKARPFEEGVDWPSFRGKDAQGVSEGFPTPTKWDIESGENIRWRTEVPGLAHSSPVIWGNQLFVTTAVRVKGEQELKVGLYGDIFPIKDDSEFSYQLHCYDKNRGELLWSKECWTGVPAIQRHPKGSYAAPTPATDGQRVLAFFGSSGLYCYSVSGELLWKRDFGVLDSGFFMIKAAQWGFAASPIIHGDKVIVQVDVQDDSFISALDAATGEDLWKTPRAEVPTWSTPTVHTSADRTQVICNGWKHIGGYDLNTGEELWKLVGGGDIPVPTPIVAHDTIFITNAHGRMAPIYAIATNASGTLTINAEENEAMLWSTERRGNYMQTPIAVGDEVYFCSDAGILGCYDAKSGESIFRERLGEGRTGFSGSGVSADGALYFTSEEGDVYVVSAGHFEVLAVNSLGEECMSTPAISEGMLFYRTRRHLLAVGL